MTLSSGPRHPDGLAGLYDRLGMVEEGLRVLELKLNEASRGRPAPSTRNDVAINQRDWPAQRASEAQPGLNWYVFGTDVVRETSVLMLEAEPM